MTTKKISLELLPIEEKIYACPICNLKGTAQDIINHIELCKVQRDLAEKKYKQLHTYQNYPRLNAKDFQDIGVQIAKAIKDYYGIDMTVDLKFGYFNAKEVAASKLSIPISWNRCKIKLSCSIGDLEKMRKITHNRDWHAGKVLYEIAGLHFEFGTMPDEDYEYTVDIHIGEWPLIQKRYEQYLALCTTAKEHAILLCACDRKAIACAEEDDKFQQLSYEADQAEKLAMDKREEANTRYNAVVTEYKRKHIIPLDYDVYTLNKMREEEFKS